MSITTGHGEIKEQIPILQAQTVHGVTLVTMAEAIQAGETQAPILQLLQGAAHSITAAAREVPEAVVEAVHQVQVAVEEHVAGTDQ